jgi:hypothetical protein
MRFERLTCSLSLLVLFSAGSLGLLMAACGDDSSNAGKEETAPTNDAGTTTSPNEAGAGDAANDELPGDPPTANAAVHVKINGVERSFDGPATWTRWNVDGGAVDGFQTNARSANGWTLLLAVRETSPGTYTCEVDSVGGLSLSRWSDADGSDRTTFGGYVGREKCTITLVSHGPSKGDHVTGTFSGELDRTEGSHPETKLVLTDGTFDLVQFADTPPQ